MRFEFATATRIVFGLGTFAEAGAIAKEFGQRALVVTGRDPRRAQPLLDQLARERVAALTFTVAGEPTIDDIVGGVREGRFFKSDFVIGIGGGSVLDAAKAVAALLTNEGTPLDYLEVIGRGRPLTRPALPIVAIPTTAGTGAEVTRNAVLGSPTHGVKVSLRSPYLLPRVALIDPQLTRDLSPALTANTGLDALTQLIEPYVCLRANPMTDAICVEGIRRAARSLRQAFEHGDDLAAREDMSVASLFGGLALANSGLGAAHGFASPIGGKFPAPHGAVCAALLPHVMAANLRALRARAPKHEALARYDEIARLVTGRAQAKAEDGVKWVRELVTALEIPRLATFGLKPGDVSATVAAAEKASSMKANPIVLTKDELGEILTQAI